VARGSGAAVGGRTLVTGATGFAGSHLVDALLGAGHEVDAWSNPGGQPSSASNARLRWRAVDLLDAGTVSAAIAESAPAAIYHCAGFADVKRASAEPARALHVNALGTYHVIEAVRRARLDSAVLVTGSALVYKPSSDALREDSPISPANPYGFSKLAQEMTALHATDARVFLARPFNHAGPRQSADYSTSAFARQIAEIEAGRAEPVIYVGNLDSLRDITDVRDTVSAYRQIVERGLPHRPYNVCSGRAYRVGDLLDALIGMARVGVRVQEDESRMRPSDTPVVLGDRSRIGEETGWRPVFPLERTLEDLLDYWRRRIAPPGPSET
jgi:GDP-4-dehydro-6-deoxy-D-mannose reductase